MSSLIFLGVPLDFFFKFFFLLLLFLKFHQFLSFSLEFLDLKHFLLQVLFHDLVLLLIFRFFVMRFTTISWLFGTSLFHRVDFLLWGSLHFWTRHIRFWFLRNDYSLFWLFSFLGKWHESRRIGLALLLSVTAFAGIEDVHVSELERTCAGRSVRPIPLGSKLWVINLLLGRISLIYAEGSILMNWLLAHWNWSFGALGINTSTEW